MSRPRCAWRLAVVLVATSLLASTQGQPLSDDAGPACLADLRRSLPSEDMSEAVLAVELLVQVVRLVEPAFPALRGGQGPIPAGEPGHDAARFLHRRHLLPDDWGPDAHDDDTWRRMLRAFAARYRAEAPPVVGTNRVGMVGDAARTLAAVSAAVRPLAVFATGADDRVTFFAVIWNWTPAPRLIIIRPPDDLTLGAGGSSRERAAPVLEAMGTCALRFDSFVFAGEDIALRIFVQQGESIMRVLESEPPRPEWPAIIPADRVVDAFRFDAAELDGVEAIAVSIEGPSIGIGTAVTVLAAVRTNLGLDGILHHLAFP